MIDTENFYAKLLEKGIDFFAGVPDSLLKNFCARISDTHISNGSQKSHSIITANEGNAIAMASGYHLATGKYGCVYMQNSGIGNAVNPLLSLADGEVYSIPMLLIVGWRGEPGVHDEPQHIKQGALTLQLFETMGIKYLILDDSYEQQLDFCVKYMAENHRPIALIVRKDSFTDYPLKKPENPYSMLREEALAEILDNISGEDIVVSTTGKTSREIFELREKNHQSHATDFLTVGSMGHTASIAAGLSLGTNRQVYCIDGDGSFIMHMGSFAVIPNIVQDNFKYILINNGAHESVGGQPTAGFKIDVEKILLACGFKNVYKADDTATIKSALAKMRDEKLAALIIYTKLGSRADLGRPTIKPIDNKKHIMNKLQEQ